MSDDNTKENVKETVTKEVLNKVTEVDEQKARDYISDAVDEYFQYKVTDPDSITSEVLDKIQNDLGAVVEDSDEEQVAQFVDLDRIVQGDYTENWVSVRVEVVDIWDNDSSFIHQVGLVSDGTAQIKFTIWDRDDDDFDTYLEEGNQYELRNVIVKEHEGDYEVQVQENSEMEEVDVDLDLDQTTEFRGDVVKIYDTSGLIKRNDEGRVVSDSDEGENDLRLKLAVDNGEEVRKVIVGKELTEEVTGITLNEAIEMARDQLDRSVVYQEVKSHLILQHVNIEGVTRGEYLLASDVEVGEPPVSDIKQQASDLLMKMGDN